MALLGVYGDSSSVSSWVWRVAAGERAARLHRLSGVVFKVKCKLTSYSRLVAEFKSLSPTNGEKQVEDLAKSDAAEPLVAVIEEAGARRSLDCQNVLLTTECSLSVESQLQLQGGDGDDELRADGLSRTAGNGCHKHISMPTAEVLCCTSK
ncbi:hypothetical protein K470DRAFT_262741 [Piedraia hortae CBS 480.64]|uniref:Uncharacterized protein n=1 Tax=Piedraia hortae CBS 480.64 TaxID=1314780 RepID=A0A6A7C5I0_9PEZI|nr:hypothetical protein K470DRAFT_262741 [Piedraia hortae CBS 480.64]